VRILDLKGEVLVDALGAGGVWTFGREEAAAATPETAFVPPPELAREAPETAPVPGPLKSRDPAVPVEAGAVVERAAAPLALDDGSRVLLEPGARLQVLVNDGAQFVTVLDRGAARFELSPGGPRRWTVETSLATVEVVGAAFRIEPSPGRLVVDVERGIVLVRGDRVPGRVVRLADGQRIEVDAVAPVVSGPPAPAAPSAGPRPRPRSPAPRAAASKQAPPTLDDVLQEADRLRAAGDARAAADLLERALASAPRDAMAGLAWFTLGRIRADQLDQPERAAHAFAQVIALGQPPSLIEDAHMRRVEALVDAGRRGEAAAALGAYERAFPSSERAAALRVRLGP
jgi:transmembrane sensor